MARFMKTLPSAGIVRKRLAYNADTGIFTWRGAPCKRLSANTVAGKTCHYGYRVIKIDGVGYRAHRLAWLYMTGEQPPMIDHVNNDRSDNRWSNLRAATASLNMANSRVRTNNPVGLKGVAKLRTKRDRWGARICRDGEIRDLGRFDSPELAHAAYMSAAVDLFGAFANGGSNPE